MVEDLVRVRDQRISLLEQHCRDQDHYIDNLKRSAGQSLEELQDLREEVAGLKGQAQRTQVEFTLLRDLAQTAKREAQELRHHLAVVCNKREALAVHLLRRCKTEAAFAQLRWATEYSAACRRSQENKAEYPGTPKQFRRAALRAHYRAWVQVSSPNTDVDKDSFHVPFGSRCLNQATVFDRWMELVQKYPRTPRGGSHAPRENADAWNLIRELKTLMVARNRQKEFHNRAPVHGLGFKTLQHFIQWHKFARKRVSSKRICSQLFGRQTIQIQKDALIVWKFHILRKRKSALLQKAANQKLQSLALQTWIEGIDLAVKARAKLKKASDHLARQSKERAKECLRRWKDETEMKTGVRYALQTALQGKARPCMEAAFTAMKKAVRRWDDLRKAGESCLARHQSKTTRAVLLLWEERTTSNRARRMRVSRVVARWCTHTLRSALHLWLSCMEQRHWSRREGERFHSTALWLGPVRMALRRWRVLTQDRKQEEWVRKMADICAWPKLDQRLAVGKAIREWHRAVEVQTWQRRIRAQGLAKRNRERARLHFALWTDAVARRRRERRASARRRYRCVRLHLCAWASLLPWQRRTRKATARRAGRLAGRALRRWADACWEERASQSASDSSDSDCGDVDEAEIRRVLGPERARKWGLDGLEARNQIADKANTVEQDAVSEEVGTQMLGEVRRLQACLVLSASRKEQLLASLRSPDPTAIDSWP